MLHEKIKALEARLTELAQQEYAIDRDDTVSEAKARIESIINTTLEALADMRPATSLGSTMEQQQLSVDFANNRCWAEVRMDAEISMMNGDSAVRRELARNLAHFISEKMVVHEHHDLPRDQKVYRAEVYAFSPEEVKRHTTNGPKKWWPGYDDMYYGQKQVYDPKNWDVEWMIDGDVKEALAQVAEQKWGVKPSREQRRGSVQEKNWYDVHKKKA